MREDPDVILVGELRDLETIRLAITAAETGHLVFATMHTNSAPKTIDRIIDYGINSAKWKAARSYCADRGWQFVIMTEKDGIAGK